MDDTDSAPGPPDEVILHYTRFDESSRLADGGFGVLERLRTEQILSRELPPPPATVVDVGSGPGVYSTWLASQGYTVHAVDPVPLHIQQAETRAAEHGVELASAAVADARRVDLPSDTADAVLVMGPLYHLQQRSDRLLALTEARRMLRPGGVVAAAAVSRFAAALDGLDRSFIDDPEFAEILSETIESGRHTNPTDDLRYFTTAFFHHPAELGGELEEAGFTSVDVQAVEGIAWLAPDFRERLQDTAHRGQLFELTDRLAREPSLLGVSPHLLAIGRA